MAEAAPTTAAQTIATPFRWDRLTVGATVAYCVMGLAINIGLVLGELRDELALSGALTALHGSTFGIGMFVTGLGGNALVGRFGRVRVLWGAALGVLIGLVVFTAGFSVAMTLPGAMIAGFSAAVLVMLLPGLIADHHGPNRSVAFNAVNSYPILFSVLIAGVIGGVIGLGGSWRIAMLAVALCVIGTFAALIRPVSIPPATVDRTARPWALLSHGPTQRAWRDLVLGILVEFPIAVWSTVYVKEVAGAGDGAAPVLGSLFGVAMFANRLMMPWSIWRFGDRLREISIAATGASAVVLWAVPTLPGKVAALGLTGFCAGSLYNASTDRLFAAAPSASPQMVGTLSCLASGVAVSTGPLALGVLADVVGLDVAILIVPVLACVALLVRRRHTERDSAGVQPA